MKALLEQYREKLSDLRIGYAYEQDVAELGRVFPTRSSFPGLRHFNLELSDDPETPQVCSQWITSMISVPPQTDTFSAERTPQAESLTSLSSIGVSRLRLSPEDWKSLIGAIDFTSLVKLHLHDTNFSQDQLKVLVDRFIEVSPQPVSLREVSLARSSLSSNARTRTLWEKLRDKCPGVYIKQ
ncbi:MAG: hypothetical protein J3Q66DRAFT_370669 [Benniella sp.]|nr:MAG: hypothetical protein J3Q66DRAFT_370669 [Benniella sp.]